MKKIKKTNKTKFAKSIGISRSAQVTGGIAIATGGTAISGGIMAPIAIAGGVAISGLGGNNISTGLSQFASGIKNIVGNNYDFVDYSTNPIKHGINKVTDDDSSAEAILNITHDLADFGSSGILIGGQALNAYGNAFKMTEATKKMIGIKAITGSSIGIGGQIIEDIGKWKIS